MLLFPNAKINLGLRILRRREDGYHDIESVFFPLRFSDVLEIVSVDEASDPRPLLSISGIPVPHDENNLCLKALRLMTGRHDLPPVRMHLHKRIPVGGGLGGGSSDASHVLMGLNQLFGLELDSTVLSTYAATLGSDCPFFIHNRASMVRGRGEIIEPVALNLDNYHLLLLIPDFPVSTENAYRDVRPSEVGNAVQQILRLPVEQWKDVLKNDFEDSLLNKYPGLAGFKEALYRLGAVYASITGSGAALYGLFRKPHPKEISIPGIGIHHWEKAGP